MSFSHPSKVHYRSFRWACNSFHFLMCVFKIFQTFFGHFKPDTNIFIMRNIHFENMGLFSLGESSHEKRVSFSLNESAPNASFQLRVTWNFASFVEVPLVTATSEKNVCTYRPLSSMSGQIVGVELRPGTKWLHRLKASSA